jgi:hypothetical protein
MSRLVPYSPLHEPKKEVSLETMRQILAKHVAKKEQLSNQAGVAPSPDAAQRAPVASGSLPNRLADPPKLQWNEPVRNKDGTGYVTTVGIEHREGYGFFGEGYIIAKCFVAGIPKYTATRLRPEWKSLIGTKDTREEAEALCGEKL